jgi:hypothetical protein
MIVDLVTESTDSEIESVKAAFDEVFTESDFDESEIHDVISFLDAFSFLENSKTRLSEKSKKVIKNYYGIEL